MLRRDPDLSNYINHVCVHTKSCLPSYTFDYVRQVPTYTCGDKGILNSQRLRNFQISIENNGWNFTMNHQTFETSFVPEHNFDSFQGHAPNMREYRDMCIYIYAFYIMCIYIHIERERERERERHIHGPAHRFAYRHKSHIATLWSRIALKPHRRMLPIVAHRHCHTSHSCVQLA